MPSSSKLIPIVSVVLLTLASVTPLGLGEIASFALPLLPFAAIHYWAHKEEREIPIVFVFLTGLTIDALTYGPLGYWSLLYLAGMAATTVAIGFITRSTSLARWAVFIVVNANVCLWAWTIATAYYGHAADYWPMTAAAVLLALIYPVVAYLLGLLERWTAPPRQLIFERGT